MTLLDDDSLFHDRESEGCSTPTQQPLRQSAIGSEATSRFVTSEHSRSQRRRSPYLRYPAASWIPGGREGRDRHERSLRRQIFLLLTEPESSTASTVFYAVLMITIFGVNIIMMLQTMDAFQFTPDDCATCGGEKRYFFDVDDMVIANRNGLVSGVECVCPPEPLPYLGHILRYLMHFFAVEWILRIVCYVEKDPESTYPRRLLQWLGYLTSPTTLMDALAIFPYFLENIPHIFVSLRLLKSFRIFQLIRLGQYNELFLSLTNVMAKSLNYLRLLVLILAFGSALFGSLIYWVERGTWQYHEKSQQFLFVRIGADGVSEEPSPFRSIPEAFWWFMVTATTVGYGDYYPTSSAGKWIACFAMMVGVLVIAFPVSVFSDLWQQELKKVNGFNVLYLDEDEGDQMFATPKRVHSQDEKKIYPSMANEDTLLLPKFSSNQSDDGYSDDAVIMMKKGDLREIQRCLLRIDQEQRKLRCMLRNYQIDNPDADDCVDTGY